MQRLNWITRTIFVGLMTIKRMEHDGTECRQSATHCAAGIKLNLFLLIELLNDIDKKTLQAAIKFRRTTNLLGLMSIYIQTAL